MQKKQKFILLTLGLVLVVVSIVALGMGAYHIPPADILRMLTQKLHFGSAGGVHNMHEDVLFEIRMPRLLLGLLVGAALGISGAAIQGIFRNPLAEPGLIGISSGASLFAVLIIAFETFLFTSLAAWIGYYILAFGAFVGAGLTAFLVYRIASKNGRPNVTTMLLAGIAINAFAGALTGLMTYMSTEQQLRTITFWMLGSLGGATCDNLRALAPFILILFPRGVAGGSFGYAYRSRQTLGGCFIHTCCGSIRCGIGDHWFCGIDCSAYRSSDGRGGSPICTSWFIVIGGVGADVGRCDCPGCCCTHCIAHRRHYSFIGYTGIFVYFNQR